MDSTISLTSIPIVPHPRILKLEDETDSIALHNRIHLRYRQQSKLSEHIFKEWFTVMNSDIEDQVLDFIESCLHPDSSFFPRHENSSLNVSSVILGTHTTDHRVTVEMIRSSVQKKYNTVTVVPVDPKLDKKSSIAAHLESHEPNDKLLVMVEQTEKMDVQVLRDLMSHLVERHNRIIKKNTCPSTMVIFFKSTSRQPEDIFDQKTLSRTLKLWTMVKNPCKINESSQNLQQRLFDMPGISMKLGPKVLNYIDESFMFTNASVYSVQMIFQLALAYHYSISSNAAILPEIFEGPHTRILKGVNLASLRRLPSVVDSKEQIKVDWNNPKDVLRFYQRQVNFLRDYHEFIKLQMNSYFELIKDQSKRDFPSSFNEIYGELTTHDDLGCSSSFINAISKLKHYLTPRLVTRMDSSLSRGVMKNPLKSEKFLDVNLIFQRYKDKMLNNDNSRQVVVELIDNLIRHASTLINPFTIPLSETMYFDNLEILRKRDDLSPRLLALQSSRQRTELYNCLTNLINNSFQEITLADLYDEFEELLKDKYCSKKRKRESEQISSVKTSTKKLRRSTRGLITADKKKSETRKCDISSEDKSLFKMIFHDFINDSERSGQIRQEVRVSKKGIIEKCMWL